MRVRFGCVLLLLGAAARLAAQERGPSPTATAEAGDSLALETVTVDPRYASGGLHRELLGTDYRGLWTAPVVVPVLDLARYAGGLRPVRVGGGKQTTSLHLESGDGRKFDFRSVDKDATRVLPPKLKKSIVGKVAQDQISGFNPAAPLVANALLEAAGVRTSEHQLFVMPDDPALGEFREQFRGMVGILEEQPSKSDDEPPSFQRVRKIVKTEELYRRLARDPRERVNDRAFLAARLMDNFLGDNDRMEPQWRWLRFGKGKEAPWEPLPEDRDHAFVSYNGLPVKAAYFWNPTLVNFGPHYPDMVHLNWLANTIDRRLLGELDWPVWDSVAHELQSRLTDSVIDASVRRLPPSYYAQDGERLTQALRSRRDLLPEAARRLYRQLAMDAEVHATDSSESVVATRGPDGALDLTIRGKAAGRADDPYFHRRFRPADTKEVRLFLREGADSVLVTGAHRGPKLRIIAERDPKIVANEATGGWTRVYAAEPEVKLVGKSGPSLDRRAYRRPDSTSVIKPAPRDWGHMWRPWAGIVTGDGVDFGLGATLFTYGFRRNPYAFRLDVQGGYSTTAGAPAGQVLGDLRPGNSTTHLLFRARASGADVLRFFGVGNETPQITSGEFSKAFQNDYQLSTAIGRAIGRHLTAQAGPFLQYSTTDFGRNTLISEVRPYGSGDFGEVGAEGSLTFDSRDTTAAPTRGLYATVGGRFVPSLWDVTSTFGKVHGTVATYLTAPLPLRPTLALRVGGERVWGTFPFQEGAYIGGGNTVRGLYSRRFLGDASAYGNAELRLRVASFDFLAPGNLGVFGLSDVGRVWAAGESSDKWHTGFGGGLWVAYLDGRNTVSAAVASGDGRTALYLQAGFMF